MEPIPHELDTVRAEIEGVYVARDSRGLSSEDLERYHSLLATETQLLAQVGAASGWR
jgi:hypothetical protein